MKRKTGIISKVLLAILLIWGLLSCASTPNYDEWLGAHNLPAAMDVTGKWNAGTSWAGGWGEANLVQQDRNVYGTLGLYSVRGVVSKKSLFITISSGGYVYYSARLDMKEDGSLSGIATKEAIVESPGAAHADIALLKMTRME